MSDNFSSDRLTLNAPANNSYAITPANSTALDPIPRAVFVGTAGTIVGLLAGDTSATTFANLSNGQQLSYRFKYIKATGTTATGLVAVY